MQHKRKTNHERFEEDRNKLAIGYRLSAIGYRLSAIGYRLILGVSVTVLVFNTNATAENRSENISDKRQFSKCEMVNIETDKITRDSLNGSAYSGLESCITTINLSVLDEVSFEKYLRAVCKSGTAGCIEKICEYPSANFTQRSNVTVYSGREYKKPIEKAQFSNWIKNFATCKAGAESISKKAQAANNRNVTDNSSNACNNFYQGKSIGFKPAGFSYFGSVLDAVVLGKGNGNVSLKIVDRNFTDLYGKTLEMSCTSDQLQ